jgi:hypothetical protein
MALVQLKYERRKRQGRTKALEQSGDWQRLTEHMIQLSEAHGDLETAAELRAQLNPQPKFNPVEHPVAEPEPKQPRIRKRKKAAPSSPAIRQRKAWDEVRARHER